MVDRFRGKPAIYDRQLTSTAVDFLQPAVRQYLQTRHSNQPPAQHITAFQCQLCGDELEILYFRFGSTTEKGQRQSLANIGKEVLDSFDLNRGKTVGVGSRRLLEIAQTGGALICGRGMSAGNEP